MKVHLHVTCAREKHIYEIGMCDQECALHAFALNKVCFQFFDFLHTLQLVSKSFKAKQVALRGEIDSIKFLSRLAATCVIPKMLSNLPHDSVAAQGTRTLHSVALPLNFGGESGI